MLKYITLSIFLIFSYGDSTGIAPAHVSITNDALKSQKFLLKLGIHFFALLVFLVKINEEIIRIDAASAITPPQFIRSRS